MTLKLELGTVYWCAKDLYLLAVDHDLLIYIKHNEVVELRTTDVVSPVRVSSCTVGDLCNIWDVDLEVLDTFARNYLSPDDKRLARNLLVKPRLRTSQRGTPEQELEITKQIRRYRLGT
jgi:hypothetical protein